MTGPDDNSNRFGDDDRSRYITARDWLAVCFRQRRLVIVCFCGILIGTALVAWLWASRYYEASMQILVMPDRLNEDVSAEPGAVQTDQTVSPGQLNSEIALLQGADLLRQVVGACGLSRQGSLTDVFLPRQPSDRAQAKLEAAARRLAETLHVDAEKQANVIDVSFGSASSPETPACVLRTLGNLYLAKRLQLRRPPVLLDFFSQEADTCRASLANAEAQLADFGVHSGAVAPDVQRTLIAQKIVDAETALRTAQESVSENQGKLRSLLQQLVTSPQRVVTQEHNQAPGTLLQQLEPQLLAVKLKREQLAMKFSVDYPLVREADREVADAEAAIELAKRTELRDQTTDLDATYEMLRQEVAKTRADLAESEATASALTQSIRYFQTQAVQLDQQTVQFQGLQRESKAAETNYLLYLSKREEERSAEAMDNRRIANVVIAVPPAVPILPAYSPIKVTAIGLALSLVLAIVAAFVGEYLDSSFRTRPKYRKHWACRFWRRCRSRPHECLDRLHLHRTVRVEPTVSEHSEFARRTSLSVDLPSSPPQTEAPHHSDVRERAETSRDVWTDRIAREEHIRLIRQIFFGPGSEPARVVVFAGIDPGNGCTHVCRKAAEVLADSCSGTVCLVDADIHASTPRRPPRTRGVSARTESLATAGPVRTYVRDLETPNLWVLAGESLVPAGSAPIAGDGLRGTLDELRKRFDRVLIDAPPLNLYCEAAALGQLADGLVLVVEAGVTRRAAAREATENLRRSGVKLLGAVLNKRTFPIPEKLYRKL